MKFLRPIAAISFMSVMPAYAAPPKIQHQTLTCMPKGENARITARLTPETAIESFRAYFRWSEEKAEHYIELRRAETGDFWGLLPVPERKNDQTNYRLVVRDLEGQEANTEEVPVAVTKDCEVKLTDEEERAKKNLVIGKTLADQESVPPGFKCKGIISMITLEGMLKPNSGCQSIPPAIWIAGGAGVAAGGGVVTVTTFGAPPGPGIPVSPSRPAPQRSGN